MRRKKKKTYLPNPTGLPYVRESFDITSPQNEKITANIIMESLGDVSVVTVKSSYFQTDCKTIDWTKPDQSTYIPTVKDVKNYVTGGGGGGGYDPDGKTIKLTEDNLLVAVGLDFDDSINISSDLDVEIDAKSIKTYNFSNISWNTASQNNQIPRVSDIKNLPDGTTIQINTSGKLEVIGGGGGGGYEPDGKTIILTTDNKLTVDTDYITDGITIKTNGGKLYVPYIKVTEDSVEINAPIDLYLTAREDLTIEAVDVLTLSAAELEVAIDGSNLISITAPGIRGQGFLPINWASDAVTNCIPTVADIKSLPDNTTIKINESGKLVVITGSGGISVVTHDNTLSGDGTVSSPLKVIKGGYEPDNSTIKLNDDNKLSIPYISETPTIWEFIPLPQGDDKEVQFSHIGSNSTRFGLSFDPGSKEAMLFTEDLSTGKYASIYAHCDNISSYIRVSGIEPLQWSVSMDSSLVVTSGDVLRLPDNTTIKFNDQGQLAVIGGGGGGYEPDEKTIVLRPDNKLKVDTNYIIDGRSITLKTDNKLSVDTDYITDGITIKTNGGKIYVPYINIDDDSVEIKAPIDLDLSAQEDLTINAVDVLTLSAAELEIAIDSNSHVNITAAGIRGQGFLPIDWTSGATTNCVPTVEDIQNLPDNTTIKINESGKLVVITGSGGMSVVTHDNTLSGDGTVSSPLKVIKGGYEPDNSTIKLNGDNKLSIPYISDTPTMWEFDPLPQGDDKEVQFSHTGSNATQFGLKFDPGSKEAMLFTLDMSIGKHAAIYTHCDNVSSYIRVSGIDPLPWAKTMDTSLVVTSGDVLRLPDNNTIKFNDQGQLTVVSGGGGGYEPDYKSIALTDNKLSVIYIHNDANMWTFSPMEGDQVKPVQFGRNAGDVQGFLTFEPQEYRTSITQEYKGSVIGIDVECTPTVKSISAVSDPINWASSASANEDRYIVKKSDIKNLPDGTTIKINTAGKLVATGGGGGGGYEPDDSTIKLNIENKLTIPFAKVLSTGDLLLDANAMQIVTMNDLAIRGGAQVNIGGKQFTFKASDRMTLAGGLNLEFETPVITAPATEPIDWSTQNHNKSIPIVEDVKRYINTSDLDINGATTFHTYVTFAPSQFEHYKSNELISFESDHKHGVSLWSYDEYGDTGGGIITYSGDEGKGSRIMSKYQITMGSLDEDTGIPIIFTDPTELRVKERNHWVPVNFQNSDDDNKVPLVQDIKTYAISGVNLPGFSGEKRLEKLPINPDGTVTIPTSVAGERITGVDLSVFSGDLLEEINALSAPKGAKVKFDVIWDFRGYGKIKDFVQVTISISKIDNNTAELTATSTTPKFETITIKFGPDDIGSYPLMIDKSSPYIDKKITILSGLIIRFDDVYEYRGGSNENAIDTGYIVELGHGGEQPGLSYKSDIEDIRNEIRGTIANLPDETTIKFNTLGQLEAVGGSGGGYEPDGATIKLTTDEKLRVDTEYIADGTTINTNNDGKLSVIVSGDGLTKVSHDNTLTGDGTTANILSVNAKSIADGDLIKQLAWKENVLSVDTLTLCNTIVNDNTLKANNGTITIPFINTNNGNSWIQVKAKDTGSETYIEQSAVSEQNISIKLNLFIDGVGDNFLQITRPAGTPGSVLTTQGLQGIDWKNSPGAYIPTVGDIKNLPDNTTVTINKDGKLEVIGGGVQPDNETITINTTNNTLMAVGLASATAMNIYSHSDILIHAGYDVTIESSYLKTLNFKDIKWDMSDYDAMIPRVADIKNLPDNSTIKINENGNFSIPYVKTNSSATRIETKAKGDNGEAYVYQTTEDGQELRIRLNIWNGGVDNFVELTKTVGDTLSVLKTGGLKAVNWASAPDGSFIPTVGDIRNLLDNETITIGENAKLTAVGVTSPTSMSIYSKADMLIHADTDITIDASRLKTLNFKKIKWDIDNVEDLVLIPRVGDIKNLPDNSTLKIDNTGKLSVPFITTNIDATHIQIKAKTDTGESYIYQTADISGRRYIRLNLWNGATDNFVELTQTIGDNYSELTTGKLKGIDWVNSPNGHIPTVGDIKNLPDGTSIKINNNGKLEVTGGGYEPDGSTISLTSDKKLTIPFVKNAGSNITFTAATDMTFTASNGKAIFRANETALKSNEIANFSSGTYMLFDTPMIKTQNTKAINWTSADDTVKIPIVGDVKNYVKAIVENFNQEILALKAEINQLKQSQSSNK